MSEDIEQGSQKTELDYYSQQLNTFRETDYYCPPALMNKFHAYISHTVLIANAVKITEKLFISMGYIYPRKQVLSYE